MRWSKINQFGQRILQIPLLSIQDSVLCPAKAYNVMCEMVAAILQILYSVFLTESALLTLPFKLGLNILYARLA